MVSIIREMCIFMIIAQAILFFVPGSAYVKYVRVLVGIMLIMGITGPLFGLFMDEEKKQDIRRRVEALEESIYMEESGFTVPDNRPEVYGAVEQELKERLSECGGNWRVMNAEIAEDKVIVTVAAQEVGTEENTREVEVQEILIEPVTVLNEEEKAVGALEPSSSGVRPQEGSIQGEDGISGSEAEQNELKELYGSRIGVDAENIEIVFQ